MFMKNLSTLGAALLISLLRRRLTRGPGGA